MKPRIGYINIHVSDLDRAVAFYRDVLGFELQFSDASFNYARFDVAGMRFGVASGGDAPRDPKVEVFTGISISVDDVDAAYAEMKAKGVRFTMEPSRQPWGGYMGMFADPDGNIFYLDGVE